MSIPLPSYLSGGGGGDNRDDDLDDDHHHHQIAHHHQQRRLPDPPLCITGVICQEGSLKIPHRGTMCFRVFRPRYVHFPSKPPLVLLHGGPLVPSHYLIPLVNVITDRSLIFYDQIGCGRSIPLLANAEDLLRLDHLIQDLHHLLEHLKLLRFHLYGHSFGGIVAYEYVKKKRQQQQDNDSNAAVVASLTLASTPTSIPLVQEEIQRLLDEKQGDREAFRQAHECCAVPTPMALMDAYQQAGRPPSSSPRQSGQQPHGRFFLSAGADLEGYQATSGESDNEFPQTLVLRGQDDFVTESCWRGWKDILPMARMTELDGCSHYGMLEKEQLYGEVITAFLTNNDNPVQR